MPDEKPGSGFSSVVMLIPRNELLSAKTFIFADAFWEYAMEFAVPLWITFWTEEFDQRLERKDRTVIDDALNRAFFGRSALGGFGRAPMEGLGYWIADFFIQILPQLPRTEELLKELVWFIEELKDSWIRTKEVNWLVRKLADVGITRYMLNRAKEKRDAALALTR